MYIIRIKNGILIGTIIGNIKGLNFPTDEIIEQYKSSTEFDARVEELENEFATIPSEVESLSDYIVDVDYRVTMIELGL